MSRARPSRLLTLCLAGLAIGGAACGDDDPAVSAASSGGDQVTGSGLGTIPSLEGKTIAYIQTGSVEYFDRSMKGAKAAVEVLGGELLVYNSNYDPATELANVRTAVAKNVDGILLFSISKGTLQTSARVAKQASIPVAAFYAHVDGIDESLVAYWGQADPLEVGRLDGKAMAELLEEGDEVASVMGQLGRGEVEAYQAGFEENLEPAGIRLVAKPTADWDRQKALARTQELLVRFPDLKGLYCHNDDMAAGCIQALKQAGKRPGEIKVVTENGSDTGIELMRQGWLQANIALPPTLESALAVRALAQIIGGQDVEHPVPCYTPIQLFYPDEINELPPSASWTASPEGAREGLLATCANESPDTAFAPAQ
jgi:ribose transport system substrate-binding protein